MQRTQRNARNATHATCFLQCPSRYTILMVTTTLTRTNSLRFSRFLVLSPCHYDARCVRIRSKIPAHRIFYFSFHEFYHGMVCAQASLLENYMLDMSEESMRALVENTFAVCIPTSARTFLYIMFAFIIHPSISLSTTLPFLSVIMLHFFGTQMHTQHTYTCTCTYTCTHMHAYIHTFSHIHTHDTYTHKHAHTHTHTTYAYNYTHTHYILYHTRG